MNFQSLNQTPGENSVSTTLAPPSFPSRPGSLRVDNYAHYWTGSGTCSRYPRQLIVTFDMLPDDVSLKIFDFYVHEELYKVRRLKQCKEKWIRLTHVCRRWRSVVFQSPLRLNLRLFCTPLTPTRNILDIWPLLPLIIYDYDYNTGNRAKAYIEDNIIAALEHNDRVCHIFLINAELSYFTNSAAILKPFPELTYLQLFGREPGPILPDSFLGGSAPRLRSLHLTYVSFPGLTNLLLSVTHLVDLDLDNIPRSGYIPPEAMATSLSALTTLESLSLRFQYPRPLSSLETLRQHPPPLTRAILPSLTKIEFSGDSEYLEVILARIDAFRLDKLHITLFNQLLFDTPQLSQFISRSQRLGSPENGYIIFNPHSITVKFPSQKFPSQTADFDDVLNVNILCGASEWQLSAMEQVCTSFLPPIFMLENLYISEPWHRVLHWQDDVENTLWLDLLRSFVAVKNLYVSRKVVPLIAPSLQELVGGRTTEIFPALENILLEDFQPSTPLHKGIEKFVAARLLTSRPVAVSLWEGTDKWMG